MWRKGLLKEKMFDIYTDKSEFDGEIFMKSFENIIPRDFQGGVLVLKDGQVVFEYCQGNADHSTNTPFTSHTTITLASLSKQFVAAAIFLQIELGKLSLDDTIDQYFPQYPQGKNITICHLLHHSSGIPDYISDRIIPDAIQKYESEHGIAPTDVIEFNKCIVSECRPVSLSECFDLIGELPLYFKPGSDGRYSNTNYFLLGYILEIVSNKSFSDVMSDIFMLFGLKYTHMNGRDADACGYVKHDDIIFSCGRPSMDSGDSSVVSSLTDLGLWCKAILNADILSVNSWKECLNFNPNPYGCGLWQFDNGWFGHDGGLPGLRHWQRLNFKDKVAIILLSNVVMEEPPFLAQLMEYLIR